MTRDSQGHYRYIRRGAAMAAAGLLLVGSLVTNAHGSPARAHPAYGGSYTERVPDAPDCLDPQKTALAASGDVDGLVFDPLLSIDNKGHYVGDLATKYKVSDGGKRLTFFLRHNVRFSNGDPFTAAAVKYTFARAVNPATKSPNTAGFLSQISKTKVINPYAVQLDLTTPFRPLLSNLADSSTGIMDPKTTRAQGQNTCQKPIGTGPYKIQSTGTAFSDVTLVANKYHNFGPSWVHNKGVPYISKVVVKTVASDATAVSLLLSGGIDIMGIPGPELSRVTGNKNFVIHRSLAQSLVWLEFNTAHPPFNNVEVRKAVAEMVDRHAIIKAALGGQGRAVYGPIAPTLPDFDKSAAKLMPKYNISAAAKIIAANHATGPYTLLVPNIPTYSTISEILQQSAAQAGMKLNINPQPLASFIPAAGKGDFDILSLDYNYNDPDVLYYLLDSSQGSGAGLSWSNFNSHTLDSYLEAGRTTVNSKKVQQIYYKVQRYINKQLMFIGMVDPFDSLAVRATIKGYHIDRVGAVAAQDLYIKTK